MFKVYILYSPSIDAYYIGQIEDFEARFQCHKDKIFGRSFTKRADDWIVFLIIDCPSRKQSVNLEAHIKRMKSRRYIENLKKYPEIILRLKLKYPG
jgi:putative endonuclease